MVLESHTFIATVSLAVMALVLFWLFFIPMLRDKNESELSEEEQRYESRNS